MGRYIMILMQANPLQGSLEGVCPENRAFLLGPCNGNQRSDFQGPTLPMARIMDFRHHNKS